MTPLGTAALPGLPETCTWHPHRKASLKISHLELITKCTHGSLPENHPGAAPHTQQNISQGSNRAGEEPEELHQLCHASLFLAAPPQPLIPVLLGHPESLQATTQGAPCRVPVHGMDVSATPAQTHPIPKGFSLSSALQNSDAVPCSVWSLE